MKARRLRSRTGLAVVLALALLLSATLLAAAAPADLGPSSDSTPPTAKLVKPADDHWKGATFVTGTDFLLVGTTEDQSGIQDAWFEICPEGAEACLTDWNSAPGDESWCAIGGVPADETPGIPGQYQTEWDSTTVPDGFYFIHICAEDIAGNGNCTDGRVDLPLVDAAKQEHFNLHPDAHWVYVNNRVEIPLQIGWNLISTPLLLYDTDIEDVLADLIAHGSVEGVWTMVWQGDQQAWKHWTPGPGPVDTLTKIVDGQGYWVKMKANDTLIFIGTWKTLEDGETGPGWPVYPVHDGWNLIGYTYFGTPTIWPETVGDYLRYVLGWVAFDECGFLFHYDPWLNVWTALRPDSHIVPGWGYWLMWPPKRLGGVICF
jgi:hypothetical protein